MSNAIMCSLNGEKEKTAFNLENVFRIIECSEAKLVFSATGQGFSLDLEGRDFPVGQCEGKGDINKYFILHKSGDAYNVDEYELLFKVKEVSDHKISGVDVKGREHQCKRHERDGFQGNTLANLTVEEVEERAKSVDGSMEELTDLKDMIFKLKNGEFYESLTMEFSGKIKEIAQDLIDFRKEIQSRIEPEIVEMAARDIPEASYQLEGINKTLEASTMKIMDINEEQLELADKRVEILKAFISGNRNNGAVAEKALKVVEEDMAAMKSVSSLSVSMMGPLSFQDLVGQRIQKIIRLVKSMEIRVEDLIVSFGIKIQGHREDPARSFEDLKQDVENYKSELKGPQNEGDGLDQNDIDELLENL